MLLPLPWKPQSSLWPFIFIKPGQGRWASCAAGEMESAGVVFQHLIWRPSASQASRVPWACLWQWGLGVVLWYPGSAGWCVGTIAGPRVCSKGPGAILKKFFKGFFTAFFCKMQNMVLFGGLSYLIQLCFGNRSELSGLLRHKLVADKLITWKLSDVISKRLSMNSALLHPTQTFCSFLPFAPVISWPQILGHGSPTRLQEEFLKILKAEFSLCPFRATLSPHCWDPSPPACALQMLILAGDSATYLQLRHENSLKNLPSSNLLRCWPSGSAVVQCGYSEQVRRDSRILFGAVRKCWP